MAGAGPKQKADMLCYTTNNTIWLQNQFASLSSTPVTTPWQNSGLSSEEPFGGDKLPVAGCGRRRRGCPRGLVGLFAGRRTGASQGGQLPRPCTTQGRLCYSSAGTVKVYWKMPGNSSACMLKLQETTFHEQMYSQKMYTPSKPYRSDSNGQISDW